MKPAAVTVGTFDGFHLGHRHLVGILCDVAAERGLEPVIVTFANHPLTTLAPERAPGLLTSRSEHSLSLPGVRTALLDFDRQMAAMTASEFIGLLRERLNARLLLTGFNNRLGSDGPADIDRYRGIGAHVGCEVIAAPPLTLPDGLVPSSSAIRLALLEGNPERAAAMLGRPYRLEGTAVSGRQNGRKLGFPTINLRPDAGRLIPAPGVYAGLMDVAGHHGLPAVINIGHNPTVATAGALSIEGHAIGAELPYEYGGPVAFSFLRYLRTERRFESLDALRGAIAADVEAAADVIQPLGHRR